MKLGTIKIVVDDLIYLVFGLNVLIF